MFKRNHLLTAACIAVSLVLAGQLATGQNAAKDKMTVKSVPDAIFPDGITPKDLNQEKAIEKAFKAVTQDAMNKSGIDNIVGHLVDQDRVRMTKTLAAGRSFADIKGDKNKTFTDLVATIEGGWKSKYNQKFEMDEAKVFDKDFIQIQTGEVADANLLVGKWPIDAGILDNAMEGTGKVTQVDANEAAKKLFGGDVNLEKGRGVAIVHFFSNVNYYGLNASLIHEAGGWKFDVPNNLTAERFYENLASNLDTLNRHRDEWPADVNDGYRAFSRAVTCALYDVTLKRPPGVASDDRATKPLLNAAAGKQ